MKTAHRASSPDHARRPRTRAARLTFSLPEELKLRVQDLAEGYPGGTSGIVRIALDQFMDHPVIDLRDAPTPS